MQLLQKNNIESAIKVGPLNTNGVISGLIFKVWLMVENDKFSINMLAEKQSFKLHWTEYDEDKDEEIPHQRDIVDASVRVLSDKSYFLNQDLTIVDADYDDNKNQVTVYFRSELD